MGSPRITPAQRKAFFTMLGQGVNATEAGRQVGISKASAFRMMRGLPGGGSLAARQREQNLPAPKRWEELDADAQEGLRDFLVFRRLFFARYEQRWARDIAMRLVDALADTERRTFIDINVFPGSGKTSIGRDLCCWLLAGGGTCDPARGRALRIMVGAATMRVAKHMLLGIRRPLDLRRPHYDHDQGRAASHVLSISYGRFRPDTSEGEESSWTAEQFLVAQMGEHDVYEKEPSVQASARDSGFLGERVNLAWWDDLATVENSRTPDVASELAHWFETEAERRIEPGGVLALVGQRLGGFDLHRNRLDAQILTPEGDKVPKYQHLSFPSHHDELCDADSGGSHRQWDGATDGCLTDVRRLPVRDWLAVTEDPTYRTVFQQEDADPTEALVRQVWLDGGEDVDGYPALGCWDRDRAFGQHPSGVSKLVDYCAVDPSVSRFWSIEWWAYEPESRYNYLIWGVRRQMRAGDLLDWANDRQEFVGYMEQLQQTSVAIGHPIRCWVVESNSAHRYLLQTETYRRWRRRWPQVAVIPHETHGGNKLDPTKGVQVLSMRYKSGSKRLPRMAGQGPEGPAYLREKIRELTAFVPGRTSKHRSWDTVMSDWIGEFNLPRIVMAARRGFDQTPSANVKLPAYLRRQQHEIPLGEEALA
jgi:hypothetical protein